MIFRNVVFFFLLASYFNIQSALANEYTQKNSNTFPTFKEATPISAQRLLSLNTFEEGLYEESQGFSDSAYWHKLTFPKNTTESVDTKLHLSISYYIIDNLDFYLFHGNELQTHWTRGAFQNWNENTESYKGIWIPISLSDQKETTLLIRKQGQSPLLTPIKLFNTEEVILEKEQKLIFWTVIICSLFALLAHNIFVFILLRQPGYLYYLGINITIFIALSIITGLKLASG